MTNVEYKNQTVEHPPVFDPFAPNNVQGAYEDFLSSAKNRRELKEVAQKKSGGTAYPHLPYNSTIL